MSNYNIFIDIPNFTGLPLSHKNFVKFNGIYLLTVITFVYFKIVLLTIIIIFILPQIILFHKNHKNISLKITTLIIIINEYK
mgnify:FL=1